MELTRIGYGKEGFNLLMRCMEHFIEVNEDQEKKKVIEELFYRIREVHDFSVEGETMIIIYLTPSDMANIIYVYESEYCWTWEAGNLMRNCRNWFGELKSGL